MGIFAKTSGLNKLAEHYPAPREPVQADQIRQTVQIGAVRYRGCVIVNFNTEGLFLGVFPPLGKKENILIPWEEIRSVSKGTLYGRQGVCLSIGDPGVAVITLYRELFEQMKIYLKEGGTDTPPAWLFS